MSVADFGIVLRRAQDGELGRTIYDLEFRN